MPTVRSRAARIRLGPVGVREIEAILEDAGASDPPTAARLARLSGGRPGAALLLARTPEAIAARDEIARTVLDLVSGPPSVRLAAAKTLTSRATDLIRALDRSAASGPDGPGAPPATATDKPGRRRSRSGPSAAPETATGASDGSEPSGDGGETAAADVSDPEGEAGGRLSAGAAERRRAAIALVGVWREIARDLVVVALGEERRLRDPALLDDLRATASSLGDGAPGAVGAYLRRLDSAGELLEANVRPELVLDGLLLAWPKAMPG